jgi:hypothetical protein
MNSKIPFLKKSIFVLISLTLTIGLNFNAISQTNPGDFVNNISITKELKVPVRSAIDLAGNIYVTDANQKCIVQYDSLWNYIGKINVGEEPTSIAISDNNTMFVGDYHNGKIYKRLSNGTISTIYADTIFPSAMVVSPDNELYVVDSWSKRVLVMDFTGKVVRTFGSGIFLFPTGIAFDCKNNRVIVSEHGGFGDGFNLHTEIRIFGTSGNLISTFGGWGNAPGKFYRVQGLTVGRCGNIYVTDPYQGNISVFNENGTYVTKFGVWGDTLGELNVPMDVVFDSQERAYVISLNNRAIEVFNINDILPSASITISSSHICEGSSTPFEVHFTGTAPWTFTYTVNGANPQTVTKTYANPYILDASQAGAYSVTALTDSLNTGTCFTNTASLVLNPLPTSALTRSTIGICKGESTDIPVLFTGNAPWNFTYTVNGANPVSLEDIYTNPFNLKAIQEGTYEITSLTGGNCAGTVFTGSTAVNYNTEPVSTILASSIEICAGTSASIPIDLTGTAPWTLTYTVDDQGPTTYTNITTSPFTLNVSKPGTYQIASLSDAHCNASILNGTSVVTEHQRPALSFVSGNSTVCANDSAIIALKLSGTPPWSLTYTIDSINPTTVSGITSNLFTFYTRQQGVYKVISLNDAYCEGILFSGRNVITVNPLPALNLGPDVTICEGQSVTLDGGAGDFYLWSDYTRNKTLTVDHSGTKSITVTDVSGCQSSDQILVNVSPNPLSSFIFEVSNLEVAFTNHSTDAASYYWEFGDGFTDTVANPVHVYASAGVYSVSLKASGSSCGTSVFTDALNLMNTSTEELNSALSFTVYPNPSHGIFTLDINNPTLSKLKISILNSLGQIVYFTESNSAKVSESLNLINLASGVYSIRLASNDITKTAKLILTD